MSDLVLRRSVIVAQDQKNKTNKVRLLKDVVIPAGTIMESCDGETIRFANGNYLEVMGLTKDTSGLFIYSVDRADPEMAEWFEEVE